MAGIVEEKRLSSRGAPGLDQEALALLMESGRFDRHLRRVREIYHARRDVLAAEAALAFGPRRLHGLAAGCHALLRLPRLVEQGLVPLSITAEHAEALHEFPELTRHDPFDRLLVAQAQRADLRLLTADHVLLKLERDFILDATR